MGNTAFSLALMMAVLLLHFVALFFTKTTTNISTDQSALLALKAHIISDPQKMLKTNWSITTSFCNWVGVTCGSRHQKVIALNLSSMLLTGILTNLRRLKLINLVLNNCCGEIPSWFDSFPKLQYLSLSPNNFVGQIPSDMFEHLPRLQVLYLDGNKLSGKIPSGLFKCKELEYISLAFNSLEGILPKEIGELTMLELLFLQENQIEGKQKAFGCYFN
ncbi:hypothetical protein Gotur_035581 [Gossypium turneri]